MNMRWLRWWRWDKPRAKIDFEYWQYANVLSLPLASDRIAWVGCRKDEAVKSVLEFKDVSSLPDSATRADQLPELQQELETMGFRHLGYLEECVPNADAQGGLATFMFQGKRDTDFASKVFASGHVTEIMTAPGEIASVELERFFESQLLSFRTILENGVVVETGIRPVRLPERRDTIQPLRDALELKPVQKFINWVMGGPRWGMHHRPMAGYHCEFMDNPATREIWMHHKRRVEEIAKRQQTRIPPQNDMRFVFAMILRRQQISQFQERFVTWGETALFVLLLLVLALFFLSVGSETLRLGFNLPMEVILTLGFSTFFIALVGVAWPLRIAAGVARYLPWPRILPLKELLQSVPANGNAGEVSLRREFEDNREEANLMAVLQNVIRLKQVLFKEDKALLEKWIKARRHRRVRRQPEPQKVLRIYQRYERLLYTELKLRGLPQGPREEWTKFVFKMVIGMAIGSLLGLTLHQVNLPTGSNDLLGIAMFISGFFGTLLVDELFGVPLAVTWYFSLAYNQYGVWVGIGLGVAFSLFWQFVIKKRRFKKALGEVIEKYEL
jgi:hypothetical protein